MPLYEYRCTACGKQFERIQKFSDPPVTVCPNCGGAVEKLLSSPAIQFKGSGWYITDYARSGKSGAPSKSGEGKTEGGTSSSESTGSEATAKAEPPKADAPKKTDGSGGAA